MLHFNWTSHYKNYSFSWTFKETVFLLINLILSLYFLLEQLVWSLYTFIATVSNYMEVTHFICVPFTVWRTYKENPWRVIWNSSWVIKGKNANRNSLTIIPKSCMFTSTEKAMQMPYDMDKKQHLHWLNYRAPMWVLGLISCLELFMSFLKNFHLIWNIISLRTFDLNFLKGIQKWLI